LEGGDSLDHPSARENDESDSVGDSSHDLDDCRGSCPVARFADDAIMAFDNIVDAQRVPVVPGKRLAPFGLTPQLPRPIVWEAKSEVAGVSDCIE